MNLNNLGGVNKYFKRCIEYILVMICIINSHFLFYDNSKIFNGLNYWIDTKLSDEYAFLNFNPF